MSNNSGQQDNCLEDLEIDWTISSSLEEHMCNVSSMVESNSENNTVDKSETNTCLIHGTEVLFSR